jgi:putative MATE family efflux protein
MNNVESNEQELLSGNIRKTVWKYGIPCALITIINTLYNIVDQIFIGNKIGPLGNAATNVIFPLTTIGLAFGLLIGSGCAAQFSILLGKGEHEKAAHSVGNALVLLLIEGVLFTILSLLLLPKIVVWFGGTQAVYDYAMEYGTIICFGLPCYMITIGLSQILRADGRPRIATISTIIGCILNCILDPLFIFGFEWGMAGAAWATIIGQIASVLFSIFMTLHMKSIKLKKTDFVLDIRLCKNVAAGGLTEFALNLCVTVLFVVNNNLLTTYGAMSEYGAEIPLATYGIMMKLGHIATSLSTGMGQGTQPVIGYCYGHGSYERVKKTIRFAIIQGLTIGVCVWAVCMIFAKNILLLFGSGSELYVQFGTSLIRTYLGLVFLNSVQITASNILLSIGKAYKGAILTVTRNLILCTFSGLILCPLIGVRGVMLEGLIADAGSAILSFILIRWECRSLDALISKRGRTNE